MFYAVLAEVVYIAKLTNKYISLKYNCIGMFFLVTVVVYIIKQLFYPLSSYMCDSRLGATHLVGYQLIYEWSRRSEWATSVPMTSTVYL